MTAAAFGLCMVSLAHADIGGAGAWVFRPALICNEREQEPDDCDHSCNESERGPPMIAIMAADDCKRLQVSGLLG